MPFRLLNTGATYQHMVNKLFASMIGITMEVYVDDMLGKSIWGVDHTEDLKKSSKGCDSIRYDSTQQSVHLASSRESS